MLRTALACLVLNYAVSAAELPVLADLPAFEFTNSQGKKVGKKDLLGKVWVADFIFTRCGGTCPILSAHMADLQKAFLPREDLKLVSFTVDPEHDKPKVLAKYAAKFNASSAWEFLTAPQKRTAELMSKGFLLAGGGGDEIAHSFRFVLVDKEGRIRGYYAVQEPEKLAALKADLHSLLK